MNIRNRKTLFLQIAIVLVFLVAWQFVSANKIIKPVFIGDPVSIGQETIKYVTSGKIFPYLWFSLECFIIGFLLAIVVGTVLGILIGYKKTNYEIFSPYIYFLDSIPKIILMPLIILAFGIGFWPMVFLIFLMSFIPIVINVMQGVESTDKQLIEMAESFGGNKLFVFRTVIFMACIPFLLSGIRIARGRAITAMIIGDFFGLGLGLGYLISFHGTTFQTNKMFAVALLLVGLNFFTIYLVGLVDTSLKRRWKLN